MEFGTIAHPVASHPTTDPFMSISTPTVEKDHSDRLNAITALIAESKVAQTQQDPDRLHSLHLRFALRSTTREQHWDSSESKEALVARLTGVTSAPFGKASPSASMDMRLVPPHVTEFFAGDDLGTEYEVILFRRPKK